ncbi:MAG: hypothetical protein AAF490_17350 [Chloroflexota bacterium]
MFDKRQNPSVRKLAIGSVLGIVVTTIIIAVFFSSSQLVMTTIILAAFGAGLWYLYSGHKITPRENAKEKAEQWEQFLKEQSDSD